VGDRTTPADQRQQHDRELAEEIVEAQVEHEWSVEDQPLLGDLRIQFPTVDVNAPNHNTRKSRLVKGGEARPMMCDEGRRSL